MKGRCKIISSKNNKFNIYDYKNIDQKEIATSNEEKNKINEFANELSEKLKNNDEDIDFEKILWKNGIFCPWCKLKQYWLNGQSKKTKLYKCKNKTCRKTFSFMSNSFLAHSNLSLHKWSVYIKCFIQKLTCKQTGNIVGIHFVTAWKMRHKISLIL